MTPLLIPLAEWSDSVLRDRLRYQEHAPPVTTMGPCANGCGGNARGCGVCADCLRRELGRRAGTEERRAE